MSEQAQVQLDGSEGKGEGAYRAYPLSWTIEKSENSESVAIAFQFAIHQKWHKDDSYEQGGGQWSPVWPQGYFTYGRSYVVGKTGQVNQGSVEALAKAGLWNGDWDAIVGPPPSTFVLIEVEANVYQGKTTYRANWIHPDAEKPPTRTGGFKPVDESLLAMQRAKFQSQTKAIAGGNRAGGQAPAPPHANAPQPIAPHSQAQNGAATRSPGVQPPAPQPVNRMAPPPTATQAPRPLAPPTQRAPAAPAAPGGPSIRQGPPAMKPAVQPPSAPTSVQAPALVTPVGGFGDSAEDSERVPWDPPAQ